MNIFISGSMAYDRIMDFPGSFGDYILPDKIHVQIPEILRKISSLGKESRLEFTLFRPRPEEPQQFYAKVPIELVAQGSYHDIGLFFDKVSKLPRIINVVDFNMTRAKGKGEPENMIRASCLMNTYRFIERIPEEKKEEKTSEKK